MKKIILMGRSECGKTTLRQALKGDTLHYHKTQYVNHFDVVIDTPGEYAETNRLGYALALYSYEADVVGLVINAEEPYSLFPPNIVAQSMRPVIGIVTQIDAPRANPDQAERWLRLRDGFPGEFLYGRRDLADPRIPERTGGRSALGQERGRETEESYLYKIWEKRRIRKAAAAVFFLCPLVDSKTLA